MFNLAFTDILLLLLAAILVMAAAIDVRTFTISNRLNLAVALLAPVFWIAAGLSPWPGMAIQIGQAIAVFALFALAFYAGMMGGGDVKLAAALAMWFPLTDLIKFLVYMSLAGGVLTLVAIIVHKLRGRLGRPQIPYGVAIAAGALGILTQRFLNQFAG